MGEPRAAPRLYRRWMVRSFAARWRRDDWPVEVAISLIVAAVGVAGAWLDDPGDPGAHGAVPGMVAGAAGLVLVVRRVLPMTVLGCVLALLLVISLQDHQVGASPLALLVATHAVGRWTPVPQAYLGLGAVWTLFAVLALTGDDYFTQPVALLQPVVHTVPFAVGRWAARREERQEVDQRNARELERRRVARELHDIVSHALTAVNVQAATARHLRLDGEAAVRTFAGIEGASRSALADLRRMLDLLREDGTAAETPVSPGIDDIRDLVAAHAAVHGPVDLELDLGADEDGEQGAGGVGASVGLTVYRLVQESLTNVARHAHGAPATVVVRREGSEVVVTVEDTGSGVTTRGRRTYGLTGLGERVSIHGGSFTAGPRPGGGFRVQARLQGSR
jgi:signal transduction histidine kinase